MKYKLAKDLPFAKAGTPVDVRSDGPTFVTLSFPFGYTVLQKRFEGNAIKGLIENGWIKEEKPREFIIGVNHDGTMELLSTYTHENGVELVATKESTVNWFKVREILE